MMKRALSALVDDAPSVDDRHQSELNEAALRSRDYRELVISDLADQVAQMQATERGLREMLSVALEMLGEQERRAAANKRRLAALVDELRRYTAAAVLNETRAGAAA